MLKSNIPAALRVAAQQDSTRVLTTVLIMLFSALAGVIAPIVWWAAIPLFLTTGVAGILMSDQYAERSRAVGNLEGLTRHSKDIDELRTEYYEVLQIERETIQELKRRYHDLQALHEACEEENARIKAGL